MAKIIPIDVIKGISGKYGSKTSDYFATNKSSNQIHLAKLANPYKGPFTEQQLEQQSKFKTKQAVATAWLNANKPTNLKAAVGTREHDGTEAYQYVQKLKRTMAFSNITQVLYKYMDASNKIVLPEAAGNEAVPNPNPGNTGGTSGSGTEGSGSSSGTGTEGGGTGNGLNPGEENYVNPLD